MQSDHVYVSAYHVPPRNVHMQMHVCCVQEKKVFYLGGGPLQAFVNSQQAAVARILIANCVEN